MTETKKPSLLERLKAGFKDTKDLMFAEGKYDPSEQSKREREAYKTEPIADPYNYKLPAEPKKKDRK